MKSDKKIRVHFKSNHANPDSFPPTIEGENVFAMTKERSIKQLQITLTSSIRLNLFLTGILITFMSP